MKRIVKYLVVLLIALACIYIFWLWLQHKWDTIIKKTTASILTELTKIDKLETITKTFTKTIEWQQQISSLIPDMNVDQIIDRALFKDKTSLDIEGTVSAGYVIHDITTWAIQISRDGTITIALGEPVIFWTELTGELQILRFYISQKELLMEHALRNKIKELMLQEALSGGILEEAKSNAQKTLQNIFLNAQIQIKEVILQ